MYYHDGKVYIDDEDQCITCENFTRGICCPLIEAVGSGVVFFEDDLIVTNCGFYKEFIRHLEVVKEITAKEKD